MTLELTYPPFAYPSKRAHLTNPTNTTMIVTPVRASYVICPEAEADRPQPEAPQSGCTQSHPGTPSASH
eukprot:6025977-Prymnesium_polylepis.1